MKAAFLLLTSLLCLQSFAYEPTANDIDTFGVRAYQAFWKQFGVDNEAMVKRGRAAVDQARGDVEQYSRCIEAKQGDVCNCAAAAMARNVAVNGPDTRIGWWFASASTPIAFLKDPVASAGKFEATMQMLKTTDIGAFQFEMAKENAIRPNTPAAKAGRRNRLAVGSSIVLACTLATTTMRGEAADKTVGATYKGRAFTVGAKGQEACLSTLARETAVAVGQLLPRRDVEDYVLPTYKGVTGMTDARGVFR